MSRGCLYCIGMGVLRQFLVCECLHICAVNTHGFCVEVFYALYIKFHSVTCPNDKTFAERSRYETHVSLLLAANKNNVPSLNLRRSVVPRHTMSPTKNDRQK